MPKQTSASIKGKFYTNIGPFNFEEGKPLKALIRSQEKGEMAKSFMPEFTLILFIY
jgi:hypothetical protein